MSTLMTTRQTYAIRYRRSTAEPWALLDGAELDELSFSLAPKFSSGRVHYPYGIFAEEAVPRTALDLTDHHIYIQVHDTQGQSAEFIGYAKQVQDRLDGVVPDASGAPKRTGGCTYDVIGLEQLLDERTISATYTRRGKVARVLPINLPRRDGNAYLQGNRSHTPNSAGIYTVDAAAGDTFTAMNYLEHLAYVFEQETGWGLHFAGQYGPLETYEDHWKFEGMSYWKAICQLISPMRGLAFQAESLSDVGIIITIYSLSDVDITDTEGNVLIPASTKKLNTAGLAESALIEPPTLHYLHPYHRIVVRGEYLRACFNMGYSQETLAAGWTEAQAAAYTAGGDDAKLQDKHNDTWQRFVLPPDWDGQVDYGAGRFSVLPMIDPDTGDADLTGAHYPAAAQLAYFDDAKLRPDLPLYTAAAKELRKLAVWLHHDGKYLRVDKPGESGVKAMNVKILDDAPGFRVETPDPVYLAGNDADGSTDTWQNLLACCQLETNERVRVERVISVAGPGEIEHVKTIEVPGMHYWYIAPGTVIETAGATQTTHEGGAARSDASVLRHLADVAVAWYGKRRTKFDVNYQYAPIFPYLGYLFMDSTIAGELTPTNTVVSRITYRYAASDQGEAQRLTISTEWNAELDVAKLFRRSSGGSAGTRSLSESGHESGYESGYVRVATPSSTSGAGFLFLQLRSSSASGSGFWRADVYSQVVDDDGTENLVIEAEDVSAMPFDLPGAGVQLATTTRYPCFRVGSHYEFFAVILG